MIWKLTLEGRVDTAIAKDPEAWRREFSGLQGVERLRFGIVTIDLLGKNWCPRLYNWSDVLLECCQMVGLQRLLVEAWSEGGPLISLLIKFGFNALLAEALNTEAGRATLLSPNNRGDTALHFAAEYSNVEAARLLLNFDDAQGTLRMRPGCDGWLPIHFATMACKLHKTQLPKGSVPFWTPVLSCNGDVAVVRTLLEDCAHEQVTGQTSEKCIPLMSTDSPEVAELLLGVKSAVQKQLTLRNVYGKSAFDIAESCGNTAMVSIIDLMMKELSPAPSSRSRRSGTSNTLSTSSTTGAAPSVPWSVDDLLHLNQLPPTATAGELPKAEEEFEALNL